MNWIEMIVTVVCAVFASSGFWALITSLKEKKDAKTLMILGLGHDRIIHLCKVYLEQGWISADDFDNLYNYLYVPYEKMGGNGTAKKMMEKVEKLNNFPPSVGKEVTND